MKKAAIALTIFFIIFENIIFSQHNVLIQYDKSVPQATYASGKIEELLLSKGYILKNDASAFVISLNLDTNNLKKEAYSIISEANKILIKGGDGSGLVYGAFSLIEDLQNGTGLNQIEPRTEKPYLPFRAIKFDLPWDTYRHSYSLDQHKETCSDLKFWEAFLDMMAENRFNTLTLWNLHPYPFLIVPENFPEASPFSETEMKEWQNLFKGIFRMAKERGIDTYLVPFNIFVSPEFAKAHKVALNNLDHHHFVDGDTSEIIKRYTRECVAQTLREYPDLTGMGLTLGEAMGGMTPEEREEWMKETIIAGMQQAGRKSKLIHRIPFSSTKGSLGPTSIETEKITRQGIEKEAAMDFIEGPVWADLKFNWSHAHSTTKLIKVHGGKLYGTYFDPVPESYKIVWTARNEDFFCLRWGVPEFVRDHIKSNSPAYVGGYMTGSETYIPAKDYFTKPGKELNFSYAFERQWLFYKLWGRLLYNPATTDEIFRKEFMRRYGNEAAVMLEAGSLAGKTPLRLVSSFDCSWDFTMYSEGFMALNPATKRVEYISVDRQINQPPLDSDYVSVAEYVRNVSIGDSFPDNRITPVVLAQMLERDCNKALSLVKSLKVTDDTYLQEVSDIKAWANLGLYFSEKLKGAVALQTYRVKGGSENKTTAVNHLEKALKYWDEVIKITRPLYNDMPLVHYSEQDGKLWKENDHLRFHWEILRPDVATDVEIARNAVSPSGE